MNMKWLYLGIAILAEIVATSALKSADGFSKLFPSVIVVLGYGISFYFLSLTLRYFPIGVVYAIWSGLGITLISLIGWVFFKQHLDVPTLFGIGLIVSGVVVINLFSTSVSH